MKRIAANAPRENARSARITGLKMTGNEHPLFPSLLRHRKSVKSLVPGFRVFRVVEAGFVIGFR